jgi:hypothetical protein
MPESTTTPEVSTGEAVLFTDLQEFYLDRIQQLVNELALAAGKIANRDREIERLKSMR